MTTSTWTLREVAWDSAEAVALRQAMDDELSVRYADRFSELAQDDAATRERARAFAIDPASIVATVVVDDADGRPVGHAALRLLGEDLEVKRVFVHREARGSGASRALMGELERIAVREGHARLVLQTGDRQPDAVTLYERIGYTPIPIYPPYESLTFSRCYEKRIVGGAP